VQFAFILLGVGCTTIVYLMTRRPSGIPASPSIESSTEPSTDGTED
jgi:hypothetical protein